MFLSKNQKLVKWLDNLELLIEYYKGRKTIKTPQMLPYKIEKTVKNIKKGGAKGESYSHTLIFEDVFVNDNKNIKYDLKLKKDLEESEVKQIVEVDINFNSEKVYDEIRILKKSGFKIDVYNYGENLQYQTIVAKYKDNIVFGVEKIGFELQPKYRFKGLPN